MPAGYDVVVVGGGIGGLTVAALLSARGLNTCVLERQSQEEKPADAGSNGAQPPGREQQTRLDIKA